MQSKFPHDGLNTQPAKKAPGCSLLPAWEPKADDTQSAGRQMTLGVECASGR
jgi:hypothetical protein